jgi:Cu2+-exporting ATPase
MNAMRGHCWHCGELLPVTHAVHVRVGDTSHEVCCQGCRAAVEWIGLLGLGDYYRLRTAPAPRPAQQVDLESWRRPELARHVVRALPGGRSETMLLVEGVACTGCVWLIERALGALPGVVEVSVNAAARRARVAWRGDDNLLPRVLDTLSRAGYRALPLDAQALDDARRRESRDALKRLLVAGFGSMQGMMFAAVLYLGAIEPLDVSTRELFRWLGLLVATPVVLYSAQPFFAGAARALAARRLGMDVPVAIAVAAIYAASLIEAVRGGGHVYFDSVSMFVFFLLAGRYLEMRARHKACDLTDALARLAPPYAQRRRDDGALECVALYELVVGDRVQVDTGGIVPADGVLESAICRVDQALLTGESSPVARRRGERLIAGSAVIDGPAELRVDRVGADTTLAGIAALVARAQAARPRLACAGERAAARFVARVLALTAVTVLAWSVIDPTRAFAAALAVLVVSCPCAFALAVPAALTRAIAVLAGRGVLVVRPDAIETLAVATHVVFDKTGTLTEPTLTLAGIEPASGITPGTVLGLAAAVARESRHPAARAIASAGLGQEVGIAVDVRSHAGQGIEATVAGRRLRLGRAGFALAERPVLPRHEDAIVLADDAGELGVFRVQERLRPGARAAIDALRAQGLVVMIASGDSAGKVESVANALDIGEWRARQLPAEKLAWLAELRARGARVIAVGDGVNDAPVLAGADVAVALAGGAELTQATGDLVLAGERLEALASARALAQQTLATLRQNHHWALAYNLAAMPLAALGLVHPWLAAAGMSASSIAVVANSLRIGRRRSDPTRADTRTERVTQPVEVA